MAMKFKIGDVAWQWRNHLPTRVKVERIDFGRYQLMKDMRGYEDRWMADPHEIFKTKNACIKREIRRLKDQITYCEYFIRSEDALDSRR